ncbi:MAG: amidohydrolase family protein [Bacilli bacterium]|nr:amidohydrolase family protein [Bacilli bacterium]
MNKPFIIRGDIIFSNQDKSLNVNKNSYLVSDGYKSLGIFKRIPKKYKDYELIDYKGKLIIPGFSDLHVHAPQYQYRGTGMDVELMEWLEKYAFKEERKYGNNTYAKKAYKMFVDELKNGYTTRASIFATIHREGTRILMKLLEKSGLSTYVGLVEMDRNSPDYYRQASVEEALKDTEQWIVESQLFDNTYPIITPRFLPTCSDELMAGLSELRKKYNLKSQSHLDENPLEIQFVMEIEKDVDHYSGGYIKFDMFGLDHDCIMAHCVHNNEEEIKLLKDRGIFVAHCPESNMNVTSGIAPISKYLDMGIRVGLGSDVGGGSSLSLLRAARQSIQVSKLYRRCIDMNLRSLDSKDAFYMLTRGGGEFFGHVGSLEKGYEFDCVVVDDSKIKTLLNDSPEERIERLLYLGDESLIVAKYCKGKKII